MSISIAIFHLSDIIYKHKKILLRFVCVCVCCRWVGRGVGWWPGRDARIIIKLMYLHLFIERIFMSCAGK